MASGSSWADRQVSYHIRNYGNKLFSRYSGFSFCGGQSRTAFPPPAAPPFHSAWRTFQGGILLVPCNPDEVVRHLINFDRDSFWVVQGLLLGGMEETASLLMENMVFSILR